MATLETKWIDVGSFNFATQAYGFLGGVTGTASDTQNGTSNTSIGDLYAGSSLNGIWWLETNSLVLSINTSEDNEGWDTISIGGVPYNRADATYTTSATTTSWQWFGVSNPFGTTIGADKEVIWESSQAISIVYNSKLLGETYNRIRSGYWEKNGTDRLHNCGFTTTLPNLALSWYRGTTFIRSYTAATAATYSIGVTDTAAVDGEDVQYEIRISQGGTSLDSVFYNVIYAYQPDDTVSADSGSLTVPAGATSHDVIINGITSTRTAYRITLGSVDDDGTIGDDTGNVVANTIASLTPYTTSNNTITIPSAYLPGATPETYRIWSYRYPLTATNTENYGENKYYDFDRTFTLTRGTAPSADNTPENYINLGGNKTSAALSTTYYATFNTTTVGTTSPGTGLALGTTIDNGTAISTANGQWSTNGTTWSSTAGTVNENETVYFRGTSSSSNSTPVIHSLTIGTETKSFTTTTVAASADTTPENYTNLAGNKTSAARNTSYYATFSTAIPGTTANGTGFSLSGQINTSVTAVATNGEIRTGLDQTWSESKTVSASDTIYFYGRSSGLYSATTTHTLQIGTESQSFTTTTIAAPGDTTPIQFTFTDVPTASLDTEYNTYVQITGIDTLATASLTSYSGAVLFATSTLSTTPAFSSFSLAPKGIGNNGYVHVKIQTPDTLSTDSFGEITIGGVSDTWTVTTTSDTGPDIYGLIIKDENGVTIFDTSTISAFFKAVYTGGVSTNTGQRTLTVDISAPGVLTSDIAFQQEVEINEIKRVTIPVDGTIRYTAEYLEYSVPTSWTSVYDICVISKGDS